VALTATVQSGGTFMGFPSLVYSHGWIVLLWISSYMVVPITGFAVLGKRLAQLSRRTGAITVPDMLRERFASPTVGLVASLFILFYMSFMMVAQFKAGAIVMKIAWPGSGSLALAEDAQVGLDRAYFLGLGIFTLTVVGYTLIGGFLAAVWTDLFQSILMLAGVLLLLPLTLAAAGGLEAATRVAIANTGPDFALGPGYSTDGRQFHTPGLALSYFFVWVFAGMGSPSSMIRVMACKNTATLRRSICVLAAYNMLIYLPLVAICIAGRALVKSLPPGKSDEIIPRLAMLTTSDLAGGSFIAGLILAAPFGAVMSTVSSYLVVIASGLVRDVYHRFLRPTATTIELKRLSYFGMILVGAIAVVANLRPVAYLQAIVVFSGESAAATLLVPALMAAFWRRATAQGALAAMLAGAGTMLALYVAGWIAAAYGFDPMIGQATRFRPWYLLGMGPIVWGLSASLVAGVVGSLLSQRPSRQLVARFFETTGQSEPTTHQSESAME
jgi:SSS family solute:Na+ symporter/sodium/pantothenate symporter